MVVATRFGPSPTGELHIGGARTALFNWLWAKKNNGRFILRIEDTDQNRHNEAAVSNIQRDLCWLGLDWEGTVFRQSRRLHLYDGYAEWLLQKGLAYRKADTQAVFLGVPKSQEIIINDTIRGEVRFNTKNIKNFVIRKSNGYPSYNFACVIDDYLMEITHVIRGAEHLNNCAQQQIIRNALGIEACPVYSHVPIILNMDGSKMSKRQETDNINVIDFNNDGVLPEALINYIALLGWSPGGNKEIMNREELINLFDINRLRKSNAKFDTAKLNYFNKQYKRAMA